MSGLLYGRLGSGMKFLSTAVLIKYCVVLDFPLHNYSGLHLEQELRKLTKYLSANSATPFSLHGPFRQEFKKGKHEWQLGRLLLTVTAIFSGIYCNLTFKCAPMRHGEVRPANTYE